MSTHKRAPSWQTTLWIMFAAQLLSGVGFSIIFPFLPLYVAELGSSAGLPLELLAGAVFSSQALTMAIASPIWGSLADRLGHKLMVERAMFGGALVLLLMGFARSAEELVLLRALQGAITGTISAANALVAAVAPRERMGYAMGTLQVGLWSGMAAGPLLGGVISDLVSFRATFIVTAALLLAAGLLVLAWVREPPHAPPQPGAPRPGILAGWRSIFAMPGVTLLFGLRGLGSLAQTMLLPFVPLFILELMGSARVGIFTGLVIGLASGAGTLTALYLGRLGDRVGHRRILIGSALASAICFLPQAFVAEPWQLLALQALAGAAWGGITPSISALLAHSNRAGSEGAVYGLDHSVVSAARALAPLLGAAVVAVADLRGIFVASAVAYLLIGAVAALRLHPVAPGQPRAAGRPAGD